MIRRRRAGSISTRTSHARTASAGETFGRFNNVDIAYGVRLGSHPHPAARDVAVVSDRGCDRVRFYKIDPTDPDGPLVDVTAPNVPRVFPFRYEQPSALQPSGAVEGWRDNPVDDQNTVYGLTVSQGDVDVIFVSERERGLVRQLQIVAAPGGRLTYRPIRTFLFKTTFRLRRAAARPTTGRRAARPPSRNRNPRASSFDRANQTLYVAFETIGLYKLPLSRSTPAFVEVTGNRLIEPVKSFGQAYHAIPDDDEFECAYNPDDPPAPGDVVANRVRANAGRFLEADLEGLSIIASAPGRTLLLASSQGDSSFHFYD